MSTSVHSNADLFELSDVDSFDEEFIPDQLKRILTRKSSKFEQEIDDISNELRRVKQGQGGINLGDYPKLNLNQ